VHFALTSDPGRSPRFAGCVFRFAEQSNYSPTAKEATVWLKSISLMLHIYCRWQDAATHMHLYDTNYVHHARARARRSVVHFWCSQVM